MDWQIVLAAWGAGLSTVLALLALHGWWRDRPRIVVSVPHASTTILIMGGDQLSGRPTANVVTAVAITNAGRRPVTVVAIGATDVAAKSGTVIAADLNILLTEGARHVEEIGRARIAAGLDVEERGLDECVRYVWVRDATGREFRSTQYPLRG